MDSAQLTIIGVALLTFAATILNLFAANHREKRSRRWQIEDRLAIAHEIGEQTKVIEQAGQNRHDSLAGKIADNTQISEKAFTEANNVNAKIATLTEQILEAKLRAVELREQALAIEHKGDKGERGQQGDKGDKGDRA
jgi:hypothetical protein